MDATTRERFTNLLALVFALAVVASVAFGWADFRAGWIESARARASLVGHP